MDESYKKRMAEKYRLLSVSEKPSVSKCGVCQKPLYLTDVCPVTGRYHNTSKGDRTICGTAIDPEQRHVSGSQLVEFINKLKIAWEKSRVEKVLIDETSVSILQSFCQSIHWTPTIYGILYGSYKGPENTVEIHSIYEVESIYRNEGIREELDQRIAKVDHLATLLGIQRVGIIIARSNSPDGHVMNSEELLWAIENQSRFGDHCVTITLTPDGEDNSTHVEAWQASQQSVHLFRSKFLSKSDKVGFLHSSVAVEVADSKDGKSKSNSASSANFIDVSWLIAPVAVEAFRSPMISNRFVRIHRLENKPPGFDNMRIFMNDPEKESMSFLDKLNDFHLLIFLMESLLDPDVDLPIVVDAIRTKSEQSVEGFKLMIDACIEEA